MVLVADHGDVVVGVVEQRRGGAQLESRELVGRPGQLRAHLLDVVVVDVAVAAGPDELSHLETALQGHHAPVTLPLTQDPIAADTPIESGPLVLYNWADYIYKPIVANFEDKFGVDVQISTYNNLEEGIQKVVNGQVVPDVFVPTPGYLRRLVAKDLLQPLNHDLIPNMSNVWPSYSNPGPYYDVNWHYSVPYTIYTWGVAYRRDRVDDASAAQQGWDALWNHDYAGKISLYDSYGDTIAITILRNGSLDVNSQDPAVIDAAKQAIEQTIN